MSIKKEIKIKKKMLKEVKKDIKAARRLIDFSQARSFLESAKLAKKDLEKDIKDLTFLCQIEKELAVLFKSADSALNNFIKNNKNQ